MFILVSRCATEVPKAWGTRFVLTRKEFESTHSVVGEEYTLNGVILKASDGDRLYLSFRDL